MYTPRFHLLGMEVYIIIVSVVVYVYLTTMVDIYQILPFPYLSPSQAPLSPSLSLPPSPILPCSLATYTWILNHSIHLTVGAEL